ncbi:TadE/TadG family type IV pilus assembly protein [Methyloglobulus sp.]|uniref:TadE/TadG family type IV pilus assembly protein n=1 Tax=Methyloglobulus sp. TaxID=2518622 RepID=UPI003989EBFF
MRPVQRKQTGSSIVEFAIVLPLLLLLIAMVAEFGILFYRQNAINKVTQITARYLSDVSVNNGYTGADLTLAQARAIYGNSGNTTPVVPGLVPANIVATDLGTHVRVVATYDSDLILGSGLNGLMQLATGGSAATDFMTIHATSVMRFAQ